MFETFINSEIILLVKKLKSIVLKVKSIFYTNVLKSGRISGVSAQHCLIIFIASGGAAPFDTDGLINGGGFLIFVIISNNKILIKN